MWTRFIARQLFVVVYRIAVFVRYFSCELSISMPISLLHDFVPANRVYAIGVVVVVVIYFFFYCCVNSRELTMKYGFRFAVVRFLLAAIFFLTKLDRTCYISFVVRM